MASISAVPAAFLSSYATSQSLMVGPPGPSPHTTAAVSALSIAAARPDWLGLEDIDIPIRQRQLSHAIDEASHQFLLHSAPTIRSRALSLSSGLPHAGDWLNVVPSLTLGLHLQDRECRCSLRYWLGIPLHSNPYPCPECSATADIFGDHQVCCGGNGNHTSRHKSIRDVVFTSAMSAALAESPCVVPGSLSLPADVLDLRSPCRPRHPCDQPPLATEPLMCVSHPRICSTDRGTTQACRQPLACHEAGVDCIPIAAETLRGLAEYAIHTINSLSQAIAERAGSRDPPSATRHLFQRFAVALWCSNASFCFIAT